ncbi:antibiotic biosynthesis monooxygenase [Streptomyces corynorhini]|uniref:Antibiotic biosynthesis monooxygenase n=1 Tax=Streptomyces corynorhini TaxID=2282652 RepID=A0A370ANU2_9ACTN|nr:antibiotic biosynthesis monooxygenase [Streptomyces corynorhini]RDG31297.1 antibiotic biosynthesis monooxygenase [Streptomyces corynorhini]
MPVQLATAPDPARPGVGVVMVSTWRVGTPARQRATVDAISRVWRARAWPDAGLLSYSVAIGEDGDSLLHYSQWSGEEAYERFVGASRDERVAEIDAAVPGIERLGLGRYALYRSGASPAGDTRAPGCVVVVDVEFRPGEPGAAQIREGWVDAVFEALDTDPHLPPGGISAHFHLSTDGTRVLNYAEWESARAHIDALAAVGEGIGSPTEEWARVRAYPGVRGSTLTRYTPAISLSAG